MTHITATLGALVVAGAMSLDATEVPSFTRQTGMACTQCHVMYGAPVPNFTFTGKKFRATGYRQPSIQQKIEAGEVGAVAGRQLNLSVIPYLSFRYQSAVAQQSRAPQADEAGPIESNPTSRFSFFTGGPLGDNFGLWTEFYLIPDGSATREWGLGLFSFDEFDLRYVHTVDEKNFVGLAFNNQGVSEISGFGPWPISVPDELNNGGVYGWSHPNRGNLLAYGWIADRLLVSVGASPGQDNLNWQRSNYLGQIAFAAFNSQDRELWFNLMWKAGNDDIPMITNTTPTADRTWRYTSAVFAFAASFDEVVVVLFMAGPEQRTIPRQMFAGLREQINPTNLAVATLLILLSMALLLTLEFLRRRSERLRGFEA